MCRRIFRQEGVWQTRLPILAGVCTYLCTWEYVRACVVLRTCIIVIIIMIIIVIIVIIVLVLVWIPPHPSLSLSLSKAAHAGGFRDMAQLARDIRRSGFEPGVWLAPGAMDKHSLLAAKHPDWVLRTADGLPANSGFCGKFYYALDVTHPAARQHVSDTVRLTNDGGR